DYYCQVWDGSSDAFF
nr:immunoglobulin light chain junction region [Macaca mulatta]MOX70564.1 immunoglobulin light chain junction region [Macaca mulatta]MOX72625.1 immunoglobulin light chain junction region [Macaca mulatta]MOX72890.1 immunoglobulin light chain junction region [Macaca mulatta]